MKKIIYISALVIGISMSTYAQLKVLSNGSTQGGSTHGALRIETEYNWVDIGSDYYLGDHTHFRTNSNKGYYFDKSIEIVGGKFSSFTGPLSLATQGIPRVWLNTNGYFGIGDNTPSYELDVNGDIATYGVLISSDLRLKKDLKNLENSKVNNLYNLNAKTYIKDNSILMQNTKFNIVQTINDTAVTILEENKIDTSRKIGFIAQEFKVYFPELVSQDDEGYYSIDYISLIPILVEALKQQNENLNLKIRQLEEKIVEEKRMQPKSTILNEEYNLSFESDIEPFLGNNVPNPFDQNTEIKFYLPQEVSNANLYIYDLEGKQIQKIHVVEREYGSIIIQGSQLMPGMYYYTLIADNQIIGTKQMILTD